MRDMAGKAIADCQLPIADWQVSVRRPASALYHRLSSLRVVGTFESLGFAHGTAKPREPPDLKACAATTRRNAKDIHWQSPIADWQSAIGNRQSAIGNRQSAIGN